MNAEWEEQWTAEIEPILKHRQSLNDTTRQETEFIKKLCRIAFGCGKITALEQMLQKKMDHASN